ncbi:hypothetical protein BH23ACT4_BH23ACT4_03640 [soil metagenome]
MRVSDLTRVEALQVLGDVIREHVPTSERGGVHQLLAKIYVNSETVSGGCRTCGDDLGDYQGRGRPRAYCDLHAPKPRRKSEK